MPDLDTGAIANEIKDLAVVSVVEHAEDAIQDGMAFLASAEPQLKLYADQLARNEIDEDQLREDLSADLLALANLEKLKQAGLEQVRMAAFANGVVHILISATIRSVTGGIV